MNSPTIKKLAKENEELNQENKELKEKLERVSDIAMNVSILLDETKGKLTKLEQENQILIEELDSANKVITALSC